MCSWLHHTLDFRRALPPGVMPSLVAADFWIKVHTQYEAPLVTYQNQFIVSLQGLKGATVSVRVCSCHG